MEFMDSACEACEVCETCETSGDKYKSCGEPVVMKARILHGGCCELLVCDLCNGRGFWSIPTRPAASVRGSACASSTAGP